MHSKPFRLVIALVSISSVATLIGCGGGSSTSGGGGGNPPPAISVSVSPTSASVQVGQTQQFTASVSNTTNTAVTWQVSGVNGGNSTVGTISNSGLYTAPGSVPSPASVTVKAVSQADTTKSASATVTVTGAAGIQVSVSPGTATLGPSQMQAFTATVSGTANTAVTWSLSDSTLGSIDSTGNYTAPSSISSATSVNVIATSQADNTTQGTATVSLVVSAVINPPINACISATAQSGCIDSTFGSAGFAITNTDGSTPFQTDFEGANAIRQQSDGKLIAIGDSGPPGPAGPTSLAVVRYDSDGTLDSSFGNSGVAKYNLGSGGSDGVLDSSGNIVVIGGSQILRLLPNGSLDNTFGSSGVVQLASCGANAIALQSDGKIVVVGGATACRFNPDGTPDTTFGASGVVTVTAASGNGIQGLQLQTVAGTTDIVLGGQLGSNSSFGVVRLTSTGALDPSFGTGGQVVLFPQNQGELRSLALDPAGNILAGGAVSSEGLVLARFSPSGTLDTTFGDPASGGSGRTGTAVFNVSPGFDVVTSNTAVAVSTTSGVTRIYFAGTGVTTSPTFSSVFFVVRFVSGGTLDTSFGGLGAVAIDFGGGNNLGQSVAVQSTGEVVEAGKVGFSSGANAGYNFGLVRVWP